MTSQKSPYLRDALGGFEAYVPGEQPPMDPNLIKLNTNENPYPPSPKVEEALRGFDVDRLRRYSDPLQAEFRSAASEAIGAPAANIIGGNGSDEILAMILRAFLNAGETVAYPHPTYSLYPTLALMHEGKVCECPAALGSWKIESVLDVKAKITFIANPNAPDGFLESAENIRRLCEARQGIGIVVVDEAYVDFSEGVVVPLIAEFDNLIVTRTFSKSFSLAGLRVGLAVAAAPLMEALWAIKDSYNLGALPLALATAALRDLGYMKANARRIVETREQTASALLELGWKVYPSHTNFLFAEPHGIAARDLYARLAALKIFVRYFSAPPLDKGVRITIGTPDQMRCFLEAVKNPL